MPRAYQKRPKRILKLQHHKASGRGVVRLGGKENKRREEKKLSPIPEWSPNQLRHASGTTIRANTDIDTARTVLGHGSVSVTEIYAEADLNKAKAYAEENG